MPKIIKDIEQKIYQATLNLLKNHNYQGLSMKLIAKEAGIAVGTLYNYYNNKEELFLAVFKKSWQKTFSQLDQILTSKNSETETGLLYQLSLTLYDEIRRRRGIGNEIINAEIFKADDIADIKTNLRNKFSNALSILRTKKKCEFTAAVEIRLIDTIILTIVHLAVNYPDTRKENLEYLENLIKKI
ncbi:MAG: TetR/AcrR family transcriptional regulator [Bacillota bacterium]